MWQAPSPCRLWFWMKSLPATSPIQTSFLVSHTHLRSRRHTPPSPSTAAIAYGVGPTTLQPAAPSRTQAPPPAQDVIVEATDNHQGSRPPTGFPPQPQTRAVPAVAQQPQQPYHHQQYSLHPAVNNPPHQPAQFNSVQPHQGLAQFNPNPPAGQLYNPRPPQQPQYSQSVNPAPLYSNPGPSVTKPSYNQPPLPTVAVESQAPVKTSQSDPPPLLAQKPPAKPPEPEIPSFASEQPSDHGMYVPPPLSLPLTPHLLYALPMIVALTCLQLRSWPMP